MLWQKTEIKTRTEAPKWAVSKGSRASRDNRVETLVASREPAVLKALRKDNAVLKD